MEFIRKWGDNMDIIISEMLDNYKEDVLRIYEQGIETNLATLEAKCPTWERWNETHMKTGRIVAKIDGSVLGFAAFSRISHREAYAGVVEVSVYVDENKKRMGIGFALLNKLIEIADNNGLWTLQTTILEENEASIQLHEKCGFRKVGYRYMIGKDKFGLWRNTVLMERRSKKIGFEGCDGSCCHMKR